MFAIRKKQLLPIALIALGVMTRVLVILCCPGVKRDSLKFLAAAEKIAVGNPTALASQNLQPVYPMLLSLGWLIGFPKTFGYLINIVCSVCVMCCTYYLVVTMLKRRLAGYAAIFFCALHPLLVDIDTAILRDSLYLCFFALSLAMAIRIAQKNRPVDAVILGTVCGAAPLLREEGWELVLYFLIFCVFARYGRIVSFAGDKVRYRSIGICLTAMFAVYAMVAILASAFGYYWCNDFSHQGLFFRHLQ